MHAIPLREDETCYPDSDGEPVAESPVHLEEMIYVFEVLAGRFRNDPNVFVGAKRLGNSTTIRSKRGYRCEKLDL